MRVFSEGLSIHRFDDELIIRHILQMLAIRALAILHSGLHQLITSNPTVLKSDFFGNGDRQALSTLHGAHEFACLIQGVHGAGIQPGIAAAKRLHVEGAVFQIHLVQIGNLQLATGGRPDLLGELGDAFVVEVQAGHRIVAGRVLRLLNDGDGLLVLIEFDHAVSLRIVDVVAEHCGTMFHRGGLAQCPAQTVAVEDVVAEHQRARLAGDELLADGEGLGQAVGARLLGVGEVDAVARAVTEQALEVGQVGRRGDDQDVPDARQHEGGQRVIDHGLVVDRQQLLGGHERERV